jgi:hypothetical protein
VRIWAAIESIERALPAVAVVLMLYRGWHVGTQAVIVFKGAAQYTHGMHVLCGDPNQPALPLED